MPYFLWHCPVKMSNKVKANPAKAKTRFFHCALIKLLIIEELKKMILGAKFRSWAKLEGMKFWLGELFL
jgi:hypothetical protein